MAHFEQDVMRSLGSIEATLESLADRADDDREYTRAISGRVGTLEKTNERRKGASAVIAAVVSAVVAAVIAVGKMVWSS